MAGAWQARAPPHPGCPISTVEFLGIRKRELWIERPTPHRTGSVGSRAPNIRGRIGTKPANHMSGLLPSIGGEIHAHIGRPWTSEGTRLHRSRGYSLCRDRHVSWNPFSKEPNDRPSASGGGKCFPPSMFSSSAFRRAIPNERIHPEQGVKSTLPRPVANVFDPSSRVGGRSRGFAPVDPRPSWMLEGLKVRGGSLTERGRIIGG